VLNPAPSIVSAVYDISDAAVYCTFDSPLVDGVFGTAGFAGRLNNFALQTFTSVTVTGGILKVACVSGAPDAGPNVFTSFMAGGDLMGTNGKLAQVFIDYPMTSRA